MALPWRTRKRLYRNVQDLLFMLICNRSSIFCFVFSLIIHRRMKCDLQCETGLTFCINFGLKPSELVSSWEVYYLNMQLDGCKVLSSHLDGFRQHLQNEQKQSFQKEDTNLHFYSSNDIDMLLENGDESNDDAAQKTPVKQSIRSTAHGTPDLFSPFALAKTPGTDGKPSGKYRSRVQSSPRTVTPFGNRSSKYVVQFVFNKDISDGSAEDTAAEPQSEDDVIRRMPPVPRYSLQMLGSWPTPRCRYMYDSIEEKFESLERRIKMFATALAAKETHNFSCNVALASQETVFVVGLVCCDGEGHLNDKSIMLEGSVEFSGGQTVRLDLHKLDEFSFFPGQVIGVEGNNPSGHCLVASRLFDSFPNSLSLHLGDSDAPSAKRFAVDQNSKITSSRTPKSISMLIAAGPFTTTDNLDFEPLIDLLAYARRKQPNLLVLMGPFIDSDHPQIKTGTVDKLFSQIFQEEVGARLQDYCEEMGSGARVVLVPSTCDAHHDSVFPQPPFNMDASEDSNLQVTCIANPGVFCFNGITIGCCTVDVLRHLSSEEISRIPEGSSSDRLARLATHVLKQRSFYPLFPAVSGLNLDLSVAPEALHMLSIPDVLILPSDLASFVKVLQLADTTRKTESAPSQNGNHEDYTHRQSVCINPGRLAKGINGGTFAELFTQRKHNESTIEDAANLIADSTKISIVRI